MSVSSICWICERTSLPEMLQLLSAMLKACTRQKAFSCFSMYIIWLGGWVSSAVMLLSLWIEKGWFVPYSIVLYLLRSIKQGASI